MNNRILLVYAPFARTVTSGWLPFGLAYIASYCLRKNPGLNIKAIDFTVEKFTPERWKQELDNFEPEVVGISTQTLNHQGGLLLASLTKEVNTSVVTVMGGFHPTFAVEQCLRYCDIVVRGEGEETFYEIIQGCELNAIRGISHRGNAQLIHNPPRERIKDLDSLPFPAYHLFAVERYSYIEGKQGAVMGSRGCAYDCTYCASPGFWGCRITYRSPKNIVDEVEELHRRFGFTRINFFDDTINIPIRRALDICDEIMKRELQRKLSFYALIRGNRNLVSLELFQKMKEANFEVVSLGVESGSPRVLKAMRKNLSPDEASRAIRLARKAGIKRVMGTFMVGNWDETVWDVFKTWWFVLRNNVEAGFGICIPLPGTEFNRRLREAGYLKAEPDWSKLNRYTHIPRTNKMSKATISMIHILSMWLQILLNFVRSKENKQVFSYMFACLRRFWAKV